MNCDAQGQKSVVIKQKSFNKEAQTLFLCWHTGPGISEKLYIGIVLSATEQK